MKHQMNIERFCASMLAIQNMRFEEPAEAEHVSMLHLTGSGSITIVQYCQFVGLGANSSVYAIHADGPTFAQISAVSISDCGTALFVSGGATAYVDMGNPASAIYSGNQQGIIVQSGGTAFLMPGVPDLLGGATSAKAGGLIVKGDGTLL